MLLFVLANTLSHLHGIRSKCLDVVGDKARDLGDKLKEEVSNFKNNKDDIDDKY